jgi:hypothetical protein
MPVLRNKKTPTTSSWRLSYSGMVFTDGSRNHVFRLFFLFFTFSILLCQVFFFNTFLFYLLMEINLGVKAFWYEGQRSVYMLKGFRTLTAKRKIRWNYQGWRVLCRKQSSSILTANTVTCYFALLSLCLLPQPIGCAGVSHYNQPGRPHRKWQIAMELRKIIRWRLPPTNWHKMF